MKLIDTHCHIHDPEFADAYKIPVDQIIADAKAVGVTKFILVGTSAESSQLAVSFAKAHGVFAAIALHPHEVALKSSAKIQEEFSQLVVLAGDGNKQIIAVGECGLDYYYHPEKEVQDAQKALFRQHIDLALQHDLPMIFHIRNAFDDFFVILDEYSMKGKVISGVVHSFSAHIPELMGSLKRGLYIGLNGIMTFTKDQLQLDAAKAVPLSKLVLETDAPFLTPKPFRGTMCELKHVEVTARFLSELRNEHLDTLAAATTANATKLFRL